MLTGRASGLYGRRLRACRASYDAGFLCRGVKNLVTCEIKTATDVIPSYRDGFVDVEACATLVFTVKGDHWFEREITSPGAVGIPAGNSQRIRQARAAETGASMGEIAERALRKELGMMDKRTTSKEVQAWIDLDEVRTAYSNGATEHEAIQIPWDTVQAILGHDHTGDPDEDRRLVDALLAAGAPEWVRDAEGWVDEHGWGIYHPGRA